MPSNKQRRENAQRKLARQVERRAQRARKQRLWTIVVAATAALAAVGLVVGAVIALGGDDPDPTVTAAEDTALAEPDPLAPPEPGQTPPLPDFVAPAGLGADCQYPAGSPAAEPVEAPRTGEVPTEPATVTASMSTDQGDLGLILNNGQAPCTVNSFASLAQQGYFDDTPCHRLTTSPSLAVLQCGDPTGTGTGGPGYTFANEYPTDQYQPDDPALQLPVVYPRGTLAMANAGADTNGSQFFLVYGDSQLPPNYTVFGSLDETALATLDQIAAAGVEGGGQDGAPAEPVTVTNLLLD